MNLAALIRNARKSRGLRQRHIAEAVGVTPSAVSQWEKNLTKPEPEILPALAKVLGLDPVKLSVERSGAANPLRTAHPMPGQEDPTPQHDLGPAVLITGAKVEALLDGTIQLMLMNGRAIESELKLTREQATALVTALQAVL